MNTNSVIEYYDQCHIDYKLFWKSHKNLAIHYGYHDQEHTSHEQALQNMNRALAERIGIKEEDEILDAGCGVGGSSLFLAENYQAKVCGINIQPLHLDLARKEAEARNMENLVRFEERNFCDTGLPDESFSVVWALESMCHSDDKLGFLEEAYRVLRPGGRIIVGDYVQVKPELNETEAKQLRGFLDGWILPDLAELNWFKNSLSDVGFDEIHWEDITKQIMPSSRKIWRGTWWTGVLAKPCEILGIRTPKQTANIRSGWFQYITLRDGLWKYSVMTARKPL